MALIFAVLFLCSVVRTLLLLSHVVVSGPLFARSGMCARRETQWCDVGKKTWEGRRRVAISLRGDRKDSGCSFRNWNLKFKWQTGILACVSVRANSCGAKTGFLQLGLKRRLQLTRTCVCVRAHTYMLICRSELSKLVCALIAECRLCAQNNPAWSDNPRLSPERMPGTTLAWFS